MLSAIATHLDLNKVQLMPQLNPADMQVPQMFYSYYVGLLKAGLWYKPWLRHFKQNKTQKNYFFRGLPLCSLRTRTLRVKKIAKKCFTEKKSMDSVIHG